MKIRSAPQPAEWGELTVIFDFPTNLVPPRPVYVWIPPTTGPHEILLLQDGEKVFRPRDEKGDSWSVPQRMKELWTDEGIDPPLVVAVSATENRAGEYMPQEAVTGPGAEAFIAAHEGRIYIPRSREYRLFLVEELLPFVVSTWGGGSGDRGVTVGGSSRGALFSIYAMAMHPDVFSGALCMSTHWPHGDGLVVRWLSKHLQTAGRSTGGKHHERHRVYFDYGDQGLDADYEPYQRAVDRMMLEKGYRPDIDWKTEYFPGDGHTERCWGRRLKTPLRFFYTQRKDTIV